MEHVVTPPTPKTPLPNTLESVTALARFEFEPGKSNAGTKVIMVEWQDEDKSRTKSGSWQISWSGKRTVFPADESPTDNIRRVYFMLPPGVTIPPYITLAYSFPQTESEPKKEDLFMTINPLPAIFTPELGATAKASGKKGVLHTIWAKKRLQALEREIKTEKDHNLEGIGLEMASAEKEWIESNFGVQLKPSMLDLSSVNKSVNGPISPGLQSPISPGGRRLSEKLRGLSLKTNDKDFANKTNTPSRESNPLSPEGSDMAFSSFNIFKGEPAQPRPGADKPGVPIVSAPTKRLVAQLPPDHIRKQPMQSISEALNPANTNPTGFDISNLQDIGPTEKDDGDGDDLFAIALSPKSPDDPKSPFSFSSSEIEPYAKTKGVKGS